VWLDRELGALGYTPAEVDAMYVWQAGARLGDRDHDPVVLGTRSLSLKSDEKTKPAPDGLILPPGVKTGGKAALDANMAERIARAKAEGAVAPNLADDDP
jgi:hypothetical protein